MHTIGVLNISGELNQAYIDELKKEHYQIVHIHSVRHLNETGKKMDGVIIFDENQENVGGVCNMILTIKKESKALVWTVSRTIPSVNRLVYLRLGVTGNIEQKCDPDEFRLIIRNTLDSSLQSTHYTQPKEGTTEVSMEAATPEISLNGVNQSVVINDREIGLTRLEFQVLNTLYQSSGLALSYQEIHAAIWGDSQKLSKARVSNIIFLLRKKIEPNLEDLQYIKTVRSRGYMLNVSKKSA